VFRFACTCALFLFFKTPPAPSPEPLKADTSATASAQNHTKHHIDNIHYSLIILCHTLELPLPKLDRVHFVGEVHLIKFPSLQVALLFCGLFSLSTLLSKSLEHFAIAMARLSNLRVLSRSLVSLDKKKPCSCHCLRSQIFTFWAL
jgi:hypothetical protein